MTTDANRSALASFTNDPDREWTIDDLAQFVSVGGRGPVLAGSPQTVADHLEEFAAEADVDGFNLMYATMPGTFVDVVDHLVPELDRRGRTAPKPAPGTTLRERLGGGARLPGTHVGAGFRR